MKQDDKLIRALDLVDDDLIEKAAPGRYRKKAPKKQWLRYVVAACLALCLLSGVVATWIGNSGDPSVIAPGPSLSIDGDYSAIAGKLQLLQSEDVTEFNRLFPPLTTSIPGDSFEPPLVDREELEGSTGSIYQEVTDNQVEGVIEPDTFKRTDRHLFYLDRGSLLAYSIAGESSELVGEYSRATDAEEFFLSADGQRLTLISSASSFVHVTLLDVSDPANMTELKTFRATGRYYSARMVGGKLLLLMGNNIIGEPNYSNVATFVPRYDTGDGLQTLPADRIHYPEKLNSSNYTVIYQLGEQTLLPEDSAALLSYSGRIFVSGSDIFVTRPYVEYRNTAEQMVAHAMLEIARVSYADGALTYQGAVSVEGIMKDQYSMDVHNGVLRVVTTTREVRRGEYQKQNLINAGLFCIDVAQMQVVARVEHFAPDGESVQSVRFDGTKAYVCTAVALTDPVFCFDLSDLSNITHTSTGNIPGFSSSLIQLGDGYLLGVGKGGDGMLKIEVYRADGDVVTSVCSYTRTARFSEEYKSYFIDRERGLIGLVVQNLNDLLGTEYILLRFDGENLSELVSESVDGFYIGARSTLIDGYIYVLSWSLSVFPVELN